MALLLEELVLEDDEPTLTLAPMDPPRAQVAECECPEFCERDHTNE
jgi:hypothetical protein